MSSVFGGADGFSVIACVRPSATDVANNRCVSQVKQANTGTGRAYNFYLSSGRPYVEVYNDGGVTEDCRSTTALTGAARVVIGFAYQFSNNPKCAVYIGTGSTAEATSSLSTSAPSASLSSVLTLGGGPDGSWTTIGFQGVERTGALAIYSRRLTGAEYAENAQWLVDQGWA